MNRSQLAKVISDQKDFTWDKKWVTREIPDRYLTSDEILVISGIRRCGKSTLLQQIRKYNKDKDYYLNFDDDRLINFEVNDFQTLYELFIEFYGEQKTFYFDEVQNIQGWERFVRRLYEQRIKVIVTGSNASMLSRELGTHLTGRYLAIELFPFSFDEFLQSKQSIISNVNALNTKERVLLLKEFKDFVRVGGFPAFIRDQNREYLKTLYENILFRDVMVRNNLTNEKELLQLIYFLASNLSRLSSYNKLAQIIGVSSATTIRNYIEFLRNSYILFEVNKFDFSVKKQIQNPKKIYFIDQALAASLGFQFSEEYGRIMENIVFLELKRRGKEVFYHKNRKECDFLIREGIRIKEAIQVTVSIENQETRTRELEGLFEAMDMHQLNSGLLLTESEDDEIKANNKVIRVMPVWKWLLMNDNDRK